MLRYINLEENKTKPNGTSASKGVVCTDVLVVGGEMLS